MFLMRDVTSEEKNKQKKRVQRESLSARINHFQADHLCLSSFLRRGEKQNYWGTQMNMRGNGPAFKSDTICDLHMMNETKIYISEMLIPAPLSSSTVSAAV